MVRKIRKVGNFAGCLATAIFCVSCTGTKDLSTSVKANNPTTEFIKFADVTAATGINPGGRCAAWGDLNNDGWTDLIADGRIYRNEEGKKFVDITTKTTAEYRGPCLIADFNGDGINDIYFSDNGGALFLGKGDFTFSRGKAASNPRPAFGLAAADFDNDGWVDIYIANYENWEKQLDYPDVILRNNHGELIEQWVAPDEKLMRGRGATCCDFNNDQLIDIYVSNYRLMPNFLWVNYGKWNLIDEARAFGCAGSERKDVVFQNGKGLSYGSSGHTIGSVWADFDNDSYFDLFVGNFSHPPAYQDRPMFLKNGGPEKNIASSTKAQLPIFRGRNHTALRLQATSIMMDWSIWPIPLVTKVIHRVYFVTWATGVFRTSLQALISGVIPVRSAHLPILTMTGGWICLLTASFFAIFQLLQENG